MSAEVRILSGDVVSWPSRFGRLWGWLVRYVNADEALVELERGGMLHVPVGDLTKEVDSP